MTVAGILIIGFFLAAMVNLGIQIRRFRNRRKAQKGIISLGTR